ncbi:DinB family protein [Sphingobacterium suaedae]|uniref:DinB family protein n=1 Tax=Sphingobacterium suaedae TaxID=1686402 RepID=A0ABW5KN58_9SPHI
MESLIAYFTYQYTLVQESRKTLFDYCKTISREDFIEQNSSFGRGGSIRNLLVHIGNTYEHWIIKHMLGKDINFTAYSTIHQLDGVLELFASIDHEMAQFLSRYQSSMYEAHLLDINGITKRVSPFEAFTHVITHEFHHKGQILSLSRHLGYLPVDTDIIR